MNKCVASAALAVADIKDGATVLVGGFGDAGVPQTLLAALHTQGARNLTIVSNNAGSSTSGLLRLIADGRVSKLVCSFPRAVDSPAFADLYRQGAVTLELVPQGTLAERIRAGGAGIPAFYTPTAVGTVLARGKETRDFAGRTHVLEHAIRADVALIRCAAADVMGNLVFNKTARNFNPIMCTAAAVTIVEASRIVVAGGLDPEHIITPGIFVDRVVGASVAAAPLGLAS